MIKKASLLICCTAAVLISLTSFSQGQTTVSGNVKNSTSKESIAAVSVLIKGTSIGAYTDDRGNFKFSTVQQPPFTLLFSSVGYDSLAVEFTGIPVNAELNISFALGQDIVVAASRLPQRIMEAPVSIERVNAATIRNTPGASYYDALNNVKGVDVTTSSYTFKTVSTRGFNGSGNLRFNQLVDGMDNTAPALNFSVGNVIGLTELDVDNMELLSGASSALYGSGGMNGTLLISSKDPFKYQGVSFQIKQGVMHINDTRSGATPFYDWSFRWGKKLSDKFAFKIGAEYIRADDWEADDTTNLLRTNVLSKTIPGSRTSDPNYDGVNVFGDEVNSSLKAFSQVAVLSAGLDENTAGMLNGLLLQGVPYANIKAIFASTPLAPLIPFYVGYNGPILNPAAYPDVYGSQQVSRMGYNEHEITNYDAKNLKFTAGLYYKLTDDLQASLTGNWGSGTSVYTGADRYSLKNFRIGQYKLEFRSRNWFLRGYTTQENSGESYASTLTAIAVNNSWKPNADWFGQYTAVYSDVALTTGSEEAAHAAARGYAETGRYTPGSKEFNAAFDKSITTAIGDGGSQFSDKSSLYQFEGQYNLSQFIKIVDVLVGASYRWYNLNSEGTIFADSTGPIEIGELGGYIQLQKALLNNVLMLSASGRYDKNKNFEDGRFTPRLTASIKIAKDNRIRLSYQQAYRFPTNQDQWINLRTPGSTLIGCLPDFETFYNFSGNPVYTVESVLAYRASVNMGTPNPGLLQQAEFKTAKPESVSSFEIGYRGIIAKKLLIDAYVYTSEYRDFIARSAVARGASGNPATSIMELANPLSSKNFSFVTNSPTPVKANGWGIGVEYQIGRKGYRITGNLYSDDLRDVPENLVTFFNTPKYRYNLGFANNNAYQGFGFNILYKWQDEVNWQGTFGSSTIPSFGYVDLLISYKLGKSKNLIKLGATNLFNDYYRNAFGNPYVGGLYYISFGYNVF